MIASLTEWFLSEDHNFFKYQGTCPKASWIGAKILFVSFRGSLRFPKNPCCSLRTSEGSKGLWSTNPLRDRFGPWTSWGSPWTPEVPQTFIITRAPGDSTGFFTSRIYPSSEPCGVKCLLPWFSTQTIYLCTYLLKCLLMNKRRYKRANILFQ